MTEFERLLTGLCMVAAYSLWVGYLFWKHKGKHLLRQHTQESNILIAWASQTGTAQALAKAYAANHSEFKHGVLMPLSAISPERLKEFERAVFVVSTYGHGEPPDNGRSFFKALNRTRRNETDLSHLEYEVVALGDSKYPHFCAFGEHIDKRLNALGASPVAPLVKLDHSKGEETAELAQYSSASVAVLAYEDFTLIRRRQLNSGPRHPLFEIDLYAGHNAQQWQAGDILDVLPLNTSEEIARSYTIASLSSESNIIKLIVRLAIKEDGSQGLASGWLTQQLKINDTVKARLHVNPACHLTLNNKPLLLIAAGSGLAGIRAQWMQAAEQQHTAPVYVIFGERTRELDDILSEVIPAQVLNAANVTAKRVFSRCPDHPMYVQQALQQSEDALRHVVNNDGQIYVCGSYDGMGEGVHHTLIRMLGEEQVQQLTDSHRYHRDVY